MKPEWSRAGFENILAAVQPESGRVDIQLPYSAESKAKLNVTRSRSWLAELFLPHLAKFVQRAARTQTALNLGATACALERYWLANGKYPEQLEELVPQFIKEIPREATTGGPLKYQRTGDGRFALYSLGLDGKDFGGAHFDAKGKPNGNWVWSYPPAAQPK